MSIEDVRDRIPEEWGKWIQVGPGWYDIISELNDQLAAIDPDYKVHQVKEKFGLLRFYFTGRADRFQEMHDLVNRAVEISSGTCERCGAAGRLRVDSYWAKTLCDEDAEVDLAEDA